MSNESRMCLRFASLVVLVMTAGHAATAGSQQQDKQQPIDQAAIANDSKQFSPVNADLENVARELVTLLQHPGFRGQLRGEINGAKTTENIIVLDRFLDKVAKQQVQPPGLGKARSATNRAVQRIKGTPAIDLKGIDLYFPVKEHRAKWKGNEDLLVAYQPVNEEAEINGIVAYSVKTQKRVLLDPNKPPPTPVLIVAAEEHLSHDPNYVVPDNGPKPREGLPGGPKITSPPGKFYDSERGDPGKPGQFPGNSYLFAYYTMIKRDGESWTRGDPEIEVYLMQECGSSNKYRRLNMAGVNDTYRTYYTGYYGNLYFDASCSDRVFTSIWERDSGSWVQGDCHTFPSGRRHCINVRSGDDAITGGKYYTWTQNVFYKSSFPYESVYDGLVGYWGQVQPLKRH
jgi:hypothetical protein